MSTATLASAGQISVEPGLSPAQEHIRRLRECGGSYRSIAAAAGLAPATICYLASGRPATPYTATALLAVGNAAVPRYRVDAGGTRLRLRALHVMGHGSARIAQAVGVDRTTIGKLVRGDTVTISPQLRDAITAVYDAWWDKRAPARTRLERGAATKARRRAIAGNWCAAAALDDDLLDAPGYRPQAGWRPATGTGTASDIRPPALQQEKEKRMPDDERFTWGFILEVLDVMQRHGYRPSDDQHTGQALGLIRDAARVYEGTQDAPRGGYVVMPSSPPAAPQPPDPSTVIVSANEVKILLAALDDAAEYKRDRAEACADCADQSCATCQWRLQTISAYDQLTARLLDTAAASPADTGRPLGSERPSDSSAQPDQSSKEAGQ
jgi:transcriptional regulator with XRE-family HTH domain